MIRNARRTTVMCEQDAKIIKRNFIPYGL